MCQFLLRLLRKPSLQNRINFFRNLMINESYFVILTKEIQRYRERKFNDKTDSILDIFEMGYSFQMIRVFVTPYHMDHINIWYVYFNLKKARKTQTHLIMSLIITSCNRNLHTCVIITLFWRDAKMSWNLFCFFLIWNLIAVGILLDDGFTWRAMAWNHLALNFFQ